MKLNLFNNLSISLKIPAYIVGFSVLVAIVTGFITYSKSHDVFLEATKEKLIAVQSSRINALNAYLKSVEQDLQNLSNTEYVMKALESFQTEWNNLSAANKTQYLQRAYIVDNPNPIGSKEKLDFAADGSGYSNMHKEYHALFRTFLNENGYYDIFLIDLDGNVVYTVFKELDFASNLISGEYKDTDLAKVFQASKSNLSADKQSFFDFKPYAPSHGAPASFISQSLMNPNGTLAGVLVFQLPINRINEVMQVATGLGETGEAYIVGDDYLMRSDSRFSEESTILKTKVTGETVDKGLQGENGIEIINDYRNIPVFSAYGYLDFKETRWVILTEMDVAEVMKPINEIKYYAILATLIVIIIISIISYFISLSISNPIIRIVKVMNELAKSNFDIEISGLNRMDEIGKMALAVQVFKENGIQNQRFKNEQVQMFDTLKNTSESLTASSGQLNTSSQQLAAGAEETTRQASSVASTTEEAERNVQAVASSSEEMTASIKEISKNVQEANEVTSRAVTMARETNATITKLGDSSKEIGKVVKVITSIATQTNLLALNATIEAARAGEAGKGFAVVANEVKELAKQTAKATEEISAQIEAIQKDTGTSVAAIKEIGDIIGNISEITTSIASAIEEQAATTNEISRNIQEVAMGSRDIASNIAGVAESAKDTGNGAMSIQAASEDLSKLAISLNELVSNLKL